MTIELVILPGKFTKYVLNNIGIVIPIQYATSKCYINPKKRDYDEIMGIFFFKPEYVANGSLSYVNEIRGFSH